MAGRGDVSSETDCAAIVEQTVQQFGGVSVLVNLGSVATDRAISTALRDHGSVEEGLAKRAASIPLGRNATPDDLAATSAFLASPDAGYITGQTLSVDGGGSTARS